MNIRKICLWIQAALCILICILLALAAIRIYSEGMALRAAGDHTTWIYSREKVLERLGPILPLIVGSVIFNIVIAVKGFRDENADKPVDDTECTLDLLRLKITEPSEAMNVERDRQHKLRLSGMVIAIVCMIAVAVYMLNGSHFATTEDLEGMMGQLLIHVLPWIAIAFGALIFTELSREKSMGRECELAKQRLREESDVSKKSKMESEKEVVEKYDSEKNNSKKIENEKDSSGKEAPENKKKLLIISRVCLVAVAAVCIIYGINNGSMRDVLVKAINICTECIGLG